VRANQFFVVKCGDLDMAITAQRASVMLLLQHSPCLFASSVIIIIINNTIK